jgi:hypothetical protein
MTGRRAAPLKKTAIAVAVSAFCFVSLLLVTGSVKHPLSKPAVIEPSFWADGDPLPPPIPPELGISRMNTLVADGDPLPPPIPPALGTSRMNTLVADGDPLPPPIPPQEGRGLAV